MFLWVSAQVLRKGPWGGTRLRLASFPQGDGDFCAATLDFRGKPGHWPDYEHVVGLGGNLPLGQGI